ncbi:hypothetical protein BY996DRAFT_6429735 [Phakopsora pachyrhizi]|nr:hypothetical protein BY996DRAFT_6429735 [Phakopsora pachyrhizi]
MVNQPLSPTVSIASSSSSSSVFSSPSSSITSFPSSSSSSTITSPLLLSVHRSSKPPSNHISCLPTELMVEIFNWLPSFQSTSDKLNVCYVCKAWSMPAQRVLWKELWLGSCDSVAGLSNSIDIKPQLARIPRRLRFSTSDPDYLATLDADAVFNALSKLEKLERFEVLVPYAMGDLYDSLCEDLANSPIKEVVLGADEGIGRRHVQASMRFPLLRYLELIRLGPLEDLRSLHEEWTFPNSLTELVLIQPDLPGEDLRFLLSHTKNTLRKLRIDYGHLSPEESTQIEQDELKLALSESGSQLKLIEIRWPNCTTPFINDILKTCYGLEELITLGPICEPDKVDQQATKNLKRLVFDLKPNTFPSVEFIELTLKDHKQENAGSSSLRNYLLKTAYNTMWETSAPLIEPLLTHEDQQERPNLGLLLPVNKLIDDTNYADDNISDLTTNNKWSEQCIREWKILRDRFRKSGVEFYADFFD